MTLEELLDLTVEIPNTCHLVRHAENVPIDMRQLNIATMRFFLDK